MWYTTCQLQIQRLAKELQGGRKCKLPTNGGKIHGQLRWVYTYELNVGLREGLGFTRWSVFFGPFEHCIGPVCSVMFDLAIAQLKIWPSSSISNWMNEWMNEWERGTAQMFNGEWFLRRLQHESVGRRYNKRNYNTLCLILCSLSSPPIGVSNIWLSILYRLLKHQSVFFFLRGSRVTFCL